VVETGVISTAKCAFNIKEDAADAGKVDRRA
jgi:hypothetical protein